MMDIESEGGDEGGGDGAMSGALAGTRPGTKKRKQSVGAADVKAPRVKKAKN